LGWSSVVLLRGHGRNILVDTGSFSARKPLQSRLKEKNLSRMDITDIVLTHSHYDHMMNWTLFPNARIQIAKKELDWALNVDPIESSLCAELYVRELARSPQLITFAAGDEVLPGIRTLEMPGHTPHHVVLVIDEGPKRLIVAADAVKNRAEFLALEAVSTLDGPASASSIRDVAALWREREGAMLVCGHDLPMVNVGGEPSYMGERRAGITAWLDPSLQKSTEYTFR
jgi:glyoxylase-like metal-dependent hydrolase (beta-lactamase superfamily II)